MGEGRLVGSPTEDTGLRVAWSRYWDSDLLFFTLSTNMSGFLEQVVQCSVQAPHAKKLLF